MDENIPWKIIDKYFKDNPQALINHQIESYNDFFEEGIQRVLKEKNPIKILKQQDSETDRFKLQASIFLVVMKVTNYIMENLLYMMKVTNIICIPMMLD